ncbi:uncharacterized protein TrAtP1_002367 [Trichoderma atroviride]|uniref:NmrA-like domain-containing protein n=1 Tax=Hypocrea atroviridis (strain ATCC 20476 / IMI 206040) TaxID=452589 RepID=G9P216_HYPAI|nr:uncharacterized protein TRIATDRAFT_33785 [Trichoderma atroviride IMI 206040]EHK42611.1 hypothetical protein TRIATDRAFT_33785 [Trichoderma atroviride IMI 206040]UKZ61094.1 hypothetical protein TrAtP1_002367 [Trichoderma atroviride]
MASFKHIALLGKGMLGSAILPQLLEKGFEVTLFTRSESSVKDLPSGVHVAEVDYSSISSLTDAMKGKDVVICTITSTAIPEQKVIIDAAIQAGVKRFIPADFGALSTIPSAKDLPIHISVAQIRQYLAEKAEDGQIEYTVFSNGLFLELIFSFPFVFDYANRKVDLIDNGENPFSVTTVASIGKAVSNMLKDPEGAKNRIIYIHDMTVTQAQLVRLVKKHSPPEPAWTETKVDSAVELQESLESFARDGFNMENAPRLLRSALLGGKYGGAYPNVENERFGLELWTEKELDAFVASKVQ